MLLVGALCDILGLYDHMTGAEGLKNIILAVIIRIFIALIAVWPLFIVAVLSIRGIAQNSRNSKQRLLISVGTVFLTISVPVLLFVSMNRTRFYEQQYITDRIGVFGDLRIMSSCITDLIDDEYIEYTVNELWFDKHKAISSTGKRGSSYHYEYTVSGRYYDDSSESGEIFKAQIGKEDYRRLKSELPIGFDIKVTVYKNSGFIRSIESSVDFGKEDSYSHLYELTFQDGEIIRSEKLGAIELKNLTWCGFRSGESGNISNSLFGIGADKTMAYPYNLQNFDEICLYAVADGDYRRVSNIIYKEDINQ